MKREDTWKDAIVFISSTFNDMHAERDYLVKEVFPELTEWCEKRHIRLTDIDLRWGVTEEDSSNSKTIETCLRHVDKSRPFFLCFLGQRRGWVPDYENDISPETKKRYDFKQLREDYAEDRSATEMEIEHALLKPLEILLKDDEDINNDTCRHSIFFFRDGDYSKEEKKFLSKEQRLIYTNEYLKKVDISKVMGKLKGNDDEKGKDPKLYEDILNQLKDEFANGTTTHPELISELIYDIQNTDCEYYNNLMDNLVENPTDENNLVIIAELKFKNPGIFKEITHDIKDKNETLYDELMTALENYEYKSFGIDEFCEIFKDDIIKEVVRDIEEKNEKDFNIHETELKNLRELIENKQNEANEKNVDCPDDKKIHVVIKDYEGEWDSDLTVPELSHYKFNEGVGRLTNFECDKKPLKDVIISEFKKQFEIEYKSHIEEIANKNPEIYKDEVSDIIEIKPSKDISEEDKKLVNELDQQENFCHNNSKGFVPRDEYTGYLNDYVKSDENKICLVSAEAGLGKTMLLADFATKFRDNFPNKVLYKRFCGGSDLSSKNYSLWKSIVDEAGIDDGKKFYPKNTIDLRRNIDDILNEIAKDDEVVIIIDAINQMEDGMEMLNWFSRLPNNLKLIISVKEVNIDKIPENLNKVIKRCEDEFGEECSDKLLADISFEMVEDGEIDSEQQKEIVEYLKDKKYHEELLNIKKKNIISERSFSLKKLDYKKEKNISGYVNRITEFAESSDNNICLINSELNYDKSLIFHIFNDKYSGRKIHNFKCILNKSDCPTSKVKKSIREFNGKNTIFDVTEITGKYEAIKSKLEGHIEELSDDSVVIVDLMNNDANLFNNIVNINYPCKTVIGVKKHEKKDITFHDESNYSFELKELDVEKNGIIKSYLSNYLKELDEKEIHDICNFKGSKNPLFLKILLAELRVFGSFDQLKDEIKSFGDSPLSAFDHVFDRLEKDEIERGEDIEIVKPLFSLLASSRVGGLSEDEIVTIIKDEYKLDKDDVISNVNLNLRQVRPFMARKEGRHDFFYEKFREAAEKRYVNDYNDNIKLLRDYFRDKADDNKVRRYMELPYYLNESGNDEELEQTLSSYSFIKNKLYKSEDVYSLILDYNYLDFGDTEDGPLELIQRALELSSPVLMNNPKELPVQLWGRMNEIKDPTIEKLLDDLVEDTEKEWLKPTSSILYSPKSSIIKRLLPDGNKSSSAISFNDGGKILFGSSDGALCLYDVDTNSFESLEKLDSKIAKIILKDGLLYVARGNGEIKRWNLSTRDIEEYPEINSETEINDIYVSETYGKIYAVSHSGIFSIDLETKEFKEERIEATDKKYNQILVPRRNEAILVCDEKEVDGWDVYELRKAYNRHHQQNQEEGETSTKLDSSEEIRFMGLNKRFLTLISENGQMKFWNTLKNSGGGESIAEVQVCSPNDKFTQAKTLEDENQIITISEMGVLRVWDIPQPRQPKFEIAKNDKTDIKMDIQTGIKSPTAIDYHNNGEDKWVIVGNENNDVSIIDLNKKVEENTNTRHAESVLSIKIDGNHMITASDNGEVFTWDSESEKCINKFANDFRCNSISYLHEDSKLVLAGYRTDEKGEKINKIATCNVNDSMWEAIKNEDADEEDKKDKLIVLDTTENKSGMDEVIDVTQNSSGIVFIEKNKLTIGNNEIPLDESATAVTTNNNSEDVFVGFKNGEIIKYPENVSLNNKVNSPVTKIKISDDKIIAGYENGSLEILGLDGTHITCLNGHEKEIINIYAKDSQIITVSKDNTLKMWENGECKYTYYLDIYATAINISGDKIVIGDALGNVRFFNLVNF